MAESFQKLFFSELLKRKSPGELVEEMMYLLGLKRSVAYNRISDRVPMTLEELIALSTHFQISLDSFISGSTEFVSFEFPALSRQPSKFSSFFLPVLKDINLLGKVPGATIFYATSEIPLFYYFLFEELTLFQLYNWGRTIWKIKGLDEIPFSTEGMKPFGSVMALEQRKQLWRHYSGIDSVEFWNTNIFSHTLNQIRFHAKNGLFKEPDMAKLLLDQLKELLNIMDEMAKRGRKVISGKEKGIIELYNNEITHTNNTIFVDAGIMRKVFTVYDNPNPMSSENDALCEYTRDWFEKLKMGSTQISRTTDLLRFEFFKELKDQVFRMERLLGLQ